MDIENIKDIAISIGGLVAICTLLFHIKTSRAVARQNVWDSFFRDFENINNFIVHNKNGSDGKEQAITSPYPKSKSGAENVSLIYHHLNLVFRFWINKNLLSKDEREGFE